MLSHEETLQLISKSKEGDEPAKTKLLEHNSPLIKSIIRRYKNKGVEYDDLYQLGCIGLLKAIKNFDESYGVRFSTYAVPMIAGEVKRFLRDDGSIKVSRQIKVMSGKIAQFVDEYKKTNGSAPALDVLSKQFAIEPQELIFIMDSNKVPISLYEKTDESDDRAQSLIDKIVGDDRGEEMLDKIIIKDFIADLPQKERQILVLRFFRDKTQSEIAAIVGVSQVQVSRMESKILKKLKERFNGES